MLGLVYYVNNNSTYETDSESASKTDVRGSMSELESLGLETPKLNELNDTYEVENLVDNLKQMWFQEYKSMRVFSD